MFCPNCGTKNDDSAQKCSQCGFDQKPRGAASKHKGTVMMTGSPAANLGASKPKPSPNLKGTMVGVAPPDLSGAASKAAARPAAARPAAKGPAAKGPNPNLKGTMVGVAPPGIDALQKQAAAAKPAQAAPKGPPANLKGTMIGLAPPNMGAEVEAAKAKLAAKKAEAAEARASAQEPAAAPQPAKASPPAASKGPPSQLKGTMMGVAPPDVQAQIAAARGAAAAAVAKKSEEMAPEQPIQENDPPSEPDPLGGTVVGTSPFAQGGPYGDAGAAADGGAAAVDFNDDTPPAGSTAPAPAVVTSEESASFSAPPTTPSAPPLDMGGPQPAPQFFTDEQPARIPITKSSIGPILIVAILLIVAAGVGFFLMGKSEAQDDETEKSDTIQAPTEEAPGDAEK